MSDLIKRVHQHRTGETAGFTSKYCCKRLVFIEPHETMEAGITREKQIKAGPRRRKLALIEAAGPDWSDLYEDLV